MDRIGTKRLNHNYKELSEFDDYLYEGEMHKEFAHGYGVATNPKTCFTITGNFRKNMASGVMILKDLVRQTEVQAFRNGYRFGRGTIYKHNR